MRREIIGDAALCLCDALTVLEGLDDPRALVCDPPYASGGFSEAAKLKAKGQGLRTETLAAKGWFSGDAMSSAGLGRLLRECAVSFCDQARDGATLSFFCDWRMVPTLAPWIESAGVRLQNIVVWNKGAAGLGTGFRAQHEFILHFSKGTPDYASASFGNVLAAPRMPSDRQHPTEKPVALMRAIIDTVAHRGALVVDPFMGSGTTGVAAIQGGRRFIGGERDPIHFETALARLANTSADIFETAPDRMQGALDV